MKVKDFLKSVHGAEGVCKDIMEKDVEVRLYNSDGVRITSNIELVKCNYMFSPWLEKDGDNRGSMVLEVKINS